MKYGKGLANKAFELKGSQLQLENVVTILKEELMRTSNNVEEIEEMNLYIEDLDTVLEGLINRHNEFKELALNKIKEIKGEI